MIGKLFRLLLDSILPRRCRKCGQILTIEGELCEKCLNELNFIFPPYCRKCGHPLSEKEARGKMLCASCLRQKRFPFRLSRSALCYDEASKNLILAFKFMDRTENARLLAAMLKVAGEDIFKAGVDVIVPLQSGGASGPRTRPLYRAAGRLLFSCPSQENPPAGGVFRF